jgi:hypothetical protein
MHVDADDPAQPLVPRQAEQIIDMVGLAPAHQFLTAEARVSPEHDAYFRPARTQLLYDAADLFDRAGSSILVGRP